MSTSHVLDLAAMTTKVVWSCECRVLAVAVPMGETRECRAVVVKEKESGQLSGGGGGGEGGHLTVAPSICFHVGGWD